jgi:hypothetical protein
MGYQVFERKLVRHIEAALSLQKTGRIILNKAAIACISEGGPVAHVLVLWDAEKRKVAIRPIFKKDPRAYSVRYGKAGGSQTGTIGAKTFLDHIGLNYSETRQYVAEWKAEESLLEVTIPIDAFKASARQATILPIASPGRRNATL